MQGSTLGAVFDGRPNNFHALRLAAALLVLVSHSYAVVGEPDPFVGLFRFQTGGGLAVAVFFAISGLLVCRSVLTWPIGAYLASRALRIVPALAVLVLLQVMVLGPIFTSLDWAAYLAHPQTLKQFGNATVFWQSSVLPGVFGENPIRNSINNSLWTLPVEFLCYLLLPVALAFGLLGRWSVLILLGAFVGATLFMSVVLGLNFSNFGGMVASGVPTYRFTYNGCFFLAGATAWLWRHQLSLRWDLLFLLIAIAALGQATEFGRVFYMAAIVYGVLVLAFRTPALPIKNDVSYGVYLYAFPLQQAAVALFGVTSGLTNAAIVLGPVLLLAYLSWTFVERPLLSLRPHRSARPSTTAGMPALATPPAP